jgi:hypothetical protein
MSPEPLPLEPPPDAPVDPAKLSMLDLLTSIETMIDLARCGLSMEDAGTIHVIVNPASGWAKYHACATLDAAVAILRPFYGQKIQAFVFVGGRQLKTSQGGNYLLTPDGPMALFGAASDMTPDEDGFLGDFPQLVVPTPPPAPDDEPDEDEDDAEDVDEDDIEDDAG